MPTYEYKCPNCDRFEIEQRITEEALSCCPTCAAPVKRLMPRRLFIQFKGPGFHVNDYSATGQRSSSAPSAAADDGSSSSKAEPKPEVTAADKTESKPAATED